MEDAICTMRRWEEYYQKKGHDDLFDRGRSRTSSRSSLTRFRREAAASACSEPGRGACLKTFARCLVTVREHEEIFRDVKSVLSPRHRAIGSKNIRVPREAVPPRSAHGRASV
jgi:hypothetical protein